MLSDEDNDLEEQGNFQREIINLKKSVTESFYKIKSSWNLLKYFTCC